jgi:hypothetical protein
MTIRAIFIGLLLALFLSVATYYNDFIISQSLLIGHLLPATVLGALLLLALVLNPLMGRYTPQWMFGRGELAVIAALGLAACSWPDAGMYRTATTNLAMPAHLHKTRPHWQAAELMGYLPGGSASLTAGHVRDWAELARRIVAAGENEPDTPAGQLWRSLPPAQQDLLRDTAASPSASVNEGDHVRRAINEALALRPLTPQPLPRELAVHEMVAFNRGLLVEQFGDLVLPPPRGEGALLAGGRDDPVVVGTLLSGRPAHDLWGMRDLPWSAWWPSIRLWGGSALLVGLATFCLALIVHPQWSRNELLAYPIARFVSESIAREPHRLLPKVAYSKAFLYAFGVVSAIHIINGLSISLGGQEQVQLGFSFDPLRVLFPTASRIGEASAYFNPRIFLSAVAFAFFLPVIVSFSLGISPLLFVLLATGLISQGVMIDSQYVGSGKSNMLRFGAYVGYAIIIIYTGRRYYARVAGSALGLGASQIPAHVTWAARALVVATAGAIALLHGGGLGWGMATICILLTLLIYVVLTRIVAETGMFFVQTFWMPVAAITALLGFDAVGPTTYLMLALASTMLVGDPRTALMPNLINALRIADHTDDARVGAARLSPWLLVVIVGGFVVAGAVTLQLQYNYGILRTDTWTREMLPAMPFDELSNFVSNAAAKGTLTDATTREGLGRLEMMRFNPEAWGWMALGLGLFVATALARLRLSWWPLHPVAFAVWGTFPINRFAASILIGCCIKTAVVRLGGERTYSTLIPAAVGVIAAEVACKLLGMILGASYYMVTGHSPQVYFIF